jgi:hypothetical protein
MQAMIIDENVPPNDTRLVVRLTETATPPSQKKTKSLWPASSNVRYIKHLGVAGFNSTLSGWF